MSERKQLGTVRGMLGAGLALLCAVTFPACGGGNRRMAAETAHHLHADVVLYEILLNDRIAQEQSLYELRRERVRQEVNDLLVNDLNQLRRNRSTELASLMTGDPSREVQIGSVVRFLNDSVVAEYDLYRRILEKQAMATNEYEATLDRLERERENLAQIEEELAGLSTKAKFRKKTQELMVKADELLDELEKAKRASSADLAK